MTQENSTPENDQPVERRDEIEAAFEQHEAAAAAVKETAPNLSQESPEKAPVKEAAKAEVKPEGEKPAEKAEAKPEGEKPAEPEVKPDVNVEKAPQSWKPGTRALWDKVDPTVRAEIVRREKQTVQVLNESAQARQFADEFGKVTQPYAARLQALNAHPLAVYNELLKADFVLSSAPKNERAAFVAKLIKDYDVDVEALDNALAGRIQQDTDPRALAQAEVDRLLAERLAPYQQLLQREQQREQQDNQQVSTTIQQMAADTEKFPYFEDVRHDMADLLDMAVKKGRTLTLEQAYNQAVMLDPEISTLVSAQTQAAKAAEAAAKANAQAQRARRASVSVGGAPSGLVSGSPAAGDRRATIEAAFDSVGGR